MIYKVKTICIQFKQDKHRTEWLFKTLFQSIFLIKKIYCKIPIPLFSNAK